MSASLAPLADASFVALLEAVPDAMVCIAADGRVVLVNAEAERLFGYKREELIGQLVEILVPEGSRGAHPGYRAGFLADPRHRPMGGDMPFAGRRYDASTFPAEISLSAIDTGAGIMVTAAIRDITAQLRLRDLERSSQSLDSFIYSVSHDLRAPLRALSGYSGALLEEYGENLGGEGREYAERIVAVSEQMARLIDYLMQVSRISRAELHLQPVDVGEEAARITAELQSGEPDRSARFVIARPVMAQVDRRLIRTVLENLLGNAWKFSSGRDRLGVLLRARQRRRLRSRVLGQAVPAVPAATSGPRLPRHRHWHRPGHRAADRGTPRRPDLGRGRRRSGRDLLLHPGREGKRMTTPTILLVEDNPDDEALTLRAFKRSNIRNEIVVVRDGAEALAYLFPAIGDSKPSPALILLDLNLPKIGGLEVLRTMRGDERTALIPVVVLTSSKLEEDILDSYRNGANAYVRKPVKFSDFTQAVNALGVFWLLMNEPVPSHGPEIGIEIGHS
jgi:PAS domain S-box-containing protein